MQLGTYGTFHLYANVHNGSRIGRDRRYRLTDFVVVRWSGYARGPQKGTQVGGAAVVRSAVVRSEVRKNSHWRDIRVRTSKNIERRPMPFTPYHFGAGALAKSIAPRHFSFTAFAVSNVLIDVEPLVRMLGLLDDTILHGPTHTFPGAVVIAALTLPAIRLWDRAAAALHLNSLRPPAVPTWMVLISALVGTVSHVILDSMMHTDMPAIRALVGDPTARDLPPTNTEWLCLEFAWYAMLIYLARLLWRGVGLVAAATRKRGLAGQEER